MYWILFWIDFNEFIKTGKVYTALVNVEEISCNPKFKIKTIIKASIEEIRDALNDSKIPKPLRTCMPCNRMLLEKILGVEKFSNKISKLFIDPRKYPKTAKNIEEIFNNIAYMQIIYYYLSSIRKYRHPDSYFTSLLHYLFYKKELNYDKHLVKKMKRSRKFKERIERISECFRT